MTSDRELAVERVLDVLAPRQPQLDNERFAIFEWPHETGPTEVELRDLAAAIVDAVQGDADA